MTRYRALLQFSLLLAACGAPQTPSVDSPALGYSDRTGPVRAEPTPLDDIGLVRAALSTSDERDDGRYLRRYQIQLDTTRRIRIRMMSQALDPMLRLEGPGIEAIRNDDAFVGSLDAMIDFRPPENGLFTITTTTAGTGQVGSFVLSIEARDTDNLGQSYTLGSGAEGQLVLARSGEVPGTWFHFEGQAGSITELRVTSTDFDTVATLIAPNGQTWINDDANDLGPNGDERGLDSTIVAALPTTGTYLVAVTGYGQGAGAFRMRSSVRPPIVLNADGSVPEGLAGNDGGGRILGLYAGITEYPTQGQLYGCADDARLLAEAMRAAHLQSEAEQLVLPDGLATRENFLNGIRQLASRAQSQDVVLVFYSGHGGQIPAPEGSDEVDGFDETMVLFDGNLTDNQVVEALASIPAATVILAMDACNSGGFADDWVTAPGRVGLFSSDEDVLSDTAEPHEAGGYLSWHLRRGVLGEADARPRDGVLHAGELTDYINEGFMHDYALMNPDTNDRAQRLVVRRGSVTWDQILWLYPRATDLTLPPLPNNPLTTFTPRRAPQ